MCRNVTQSDNSTPFLARHVGHLSGLGPTVPALTENRYVPAYPRSSDLDEEGSEGIEAD
jgi:hypothetical protein